MARTRKEINNNTTFLHRFRELSDKSNRSYDELAAEFGAARQTVSKWIIGESIPGIDALLKMAKYFNVSADYLLGLSDTVSTDVNVKAAMEYTGLTEAAIERLHGGFDYPEYYEMHLDDVEKKENLRVTSALIASREFETMINCLGEAAKWAYLERALNELQLQRSEADILAGKTKSEPISKDEQDRITEELLRALMNEGFYIPEYHLNRLQARIAECFGGDGLLGLLDIRESLDRQQFLVSKAIMEYLGQVVKESRQRAEQKFVVSTSKSEK
jgi:plasmid maintenance system antidote protein VapI